ncbi:MAG TPA: MFS transporter [Candidatus Atribacteria bacterium]|nr:MFS transporter [Candidatus Atribacteria bacterium]
MAIMELWRKNLYAAWIAEMIAITGFNFVMPFIPFYVQELGITDVGQAAQWAGILTGVPAVVMTIFSPIWGSLADIYGRKLMVERAMFGSAISIFLMALSTNVYQLLFFRILQAALTGTVAACIALVSSSSPSQKMGYSLGLMQTAIFTGTCIGPLLGGIIADSFGYRNSFRITSILLFIAGLLVFFLVKEDFRPLSKKEISSNNFWENLRIVFSSQQLINMIFVFFLVQFSVMIVNPVFALFIKETFTSIKSISSITGTMLALTGFTSAISSAYIGRISDKYGYKKLLIVTILGAGIFYLPQAFVSSISQLMVLRIFLGLFYGGILPIANTIITLSTSPNDRGKAFGVTTSATFLGNTLGPFAGGLIASTLGLKDIFIFTSILLVLTGIWISIMVKRPKTME